jgi:hypothetical protein
MGNGNVLGVVNASVTAEDVYKVVKDRYEKASLLFDGCTILFSDDSEARTLSVIENHEANLPWLKNQETALPWLKNEHTTVTSLVLGDWGSGADLMLEIIQVFGGYIRSHKGKNWEAIYKEEDNRESYL